MPARKTTGRPFTSSSFPRSAAAVVLVGLVACRGTAQAPSDPCAGLSDSDCKGHRLQGDAPQASTEPRSSADARGPESASPTSDASSPKTPDAAGPCAAEIAAFDARGGAMGVDSPGMTSVDAWDQDCQWRVEDLEQSAMRFWEKRRGQADAGGEAAVSYAHAAVGSDASDLASPEFVNGAIAPDRLMSILEHVRIYPCLAGVTGAPRRLRVRFTVPAAGGPPRHVATDYRVALPDDARTCVVEQIARLTFPPLEIGKWAIVVHAFDARR